MLGNYSRIWACSGVWLTCSVRLHWREWTSLCQLVSVTESFLVGAGFLCPLFPLSAGTWPDLNLAMSPVCCPSLCEFICVLALSCLEDSVSLVSSIISGCYDLSASSSTQLPESWGGEVWWGSPPIQDWVLQSLSLSAHCPVLSLCVNSNLLQEVSLTRLEWGTDLWSTLVLTCHW